MKLYHYAILFVLVALSLFLLADMKTSNFTAVAEEKENLDQCFNRAIDDAALNLIETEAIDGIQINRERAVKDFFLSMYSAMGISDNLEKQELLKNYTPVIAVTCEDGYYLYYSDEYIRSDNYTYISKRWSEKLPFYYEDDDLIYGFTQSDTLTIYDKNGLLDVSKEESVITLDYHELQTSEHYSYFRSKRPDSFLLNDESFNLNRYECIVDEIEKAMSYYCNKHNSIAQQYGISYNFAMPIVDNSEWTRSVNGPCIIVVFQGYPYGNGIDGTYNRFAISGAAIHKEGVYYLEQKEWYYLYHKEDCEELTKDGIVLSKEPLKTVMEAVDAGAYACATCCPEGIHTPDYHP